MPQTATPDPRQERLLKAARDMIRTEIDREGTTADQDEVNDAMKELRAAVAEIDKHR